MKQIRMNEPQTDFKGLKPIILCLFNLIFLCTVSFSQTGLKPDILTGDTSFEWQDRNNIPFLVKGQGTVIKAKVSKGEKFIALLTSTGIEIYDLKSLNFLKKLMLKKRAIDISFTGKDEFIAYKTDDNKIIIWGIFNFSFKKANRLNESSDISFQVIGLNISFKHKNQEKIIIRNNSKHYRFAIRNRDYYASGSSDGVLYEFESGGSEYIFDIIQNAYGKLIDVSPDKTHIISKDNDKVFLFNISKPEFSKQEINSDYAIFLNNQEYIKIEGKTLVLETFKGKVNKKLEFNANITHLNVNEHGVTLISDALYLYDNKLNEKMRISERFTKAVACEDGLIALSLPIQGIYSIIEIKNNTRTLLGRSRNPILEYKNGLLYFDAVTGIKAKKNGEQNFIFIKDANNGFLLNDRVFFLINGNLYLSNNNEKINLFMNTGNNFILVQNSLFFNYNNNIHSIELSVENLDFIKSITHQNFIARIKNIRNNDFALSLEYKNMLRFFNANKEALKMGADYFSSKNNYRLALSSYEKLIEIGERTPAIFKAAGINAVKIRNYEKAIRYLQTAVNNLKNDALLHYYLGTAYLNLNSYNPAINHLNISIKLDDNNMKAYQNLGLLYRKIKNYSMAEKTYLNGLAINENSDDLYFNLGRLYELTNKLPLSLICYKTAFQLKPNDHYYAYQISQIYNKLEKWDSALIYLQKAVRINPDYAPAQYNLGYIYEKHKNNVILAGYHYKFFLELEPEPESRYKKHINNFFQKNK